MRKSLVWGGGVVLALLFFSGCAKPLYVRSEQRPSYLEAPAKGTGYVKKAAIVVKGGAPAPVGPQAEALLLQTLTAAIRNHKPAIELVTPHDPHYPAFMKIYRPITGRDAFSATQTARSEGFHNLIQGAVENIRVHEEKRGIWWFRKMRYFLTIVVSLDVYDTFTGAKIISEVRERTETIDPDSYAAFLSESPQTMEAVDAMIVRVAGNMGKRTGGAIVNGKWIASVAEVRDHQVSLTPGISAGLKVGDRLAVYEGRRIVDGSEGEKFIAPGYKVAEVQITALSAHGATASLEAPADIRPGDVAVPAR
jgi:hypothetical protein